MGPGTEDEKMELKVGDKVIFAPSMLEQMSSTAAKKWLIMNHRDILADC